MRVRHCPAARVTVSCRLDGRAAGGMADTLRRRGLDGDAPTDPRLEPMADAFWRFRCRRVFRRVQGGVARPGDLLRLGFALRLPVPVVARIGDAPEFWPAWEALEAASPVLKRRPLPASALAREADAARLVLRGLRGASSVAAKAAALLPWVRSPGAGRGGSVRPVPAG